MKVIKTFTYPDFPTPDIDTEIQKAVRIVLVDTSNMVLLIYSAKMGIYKIAGGKVLAGEKIFDAAQRESIAETGCDVEILGEIGEIVEKRPAGLDGKEVNTFQSSYCFYGRINSEGEVQASEKKRERGFEFVWVPEREVLEKMKNSKPQTLKADGIRKRDMVVFEEYLKISKNIGNS